MSAYSFRWVPATKVTKPLRLKQPPMLGDRVEFQMGMTIYHGLDVDRVRTFVTDPTTCTLGQSPLSGSYHIEGPPQRAGSTIRVRVQLLNTFSSPLNMARVMTIRKYLQLTRLFREGDSCAAKATEIAGIPAPPFEKEFGDIRSEIQCLDDLAAELCRTWFGVRSLDDPYTPPVASSSVALAPAPMVCPDCLGKGRIELFRTIKPCPNPNCTGGQIQV
jgi:hypothetical protein